MVLDSVPLLKVVSAKGEICQCHPMTIWIECFEEEMAEDLMMEVVLLCYSPLIYGANVQEQDESLQTRVTVWKN